jgi:hypothetical protein
MFASETIWNTLTGGNAEPAGNLKLVDPTLQMRQSTQAV